MLSNASRLWTLPCSPQPRENWEKNEKRPSRVQDPMKSVSDKCPKRPHRAEECHSSGHSFWPLSVAKLAIDPSAVGSPSDSRLALQGGESGFSWVGRFH
ncbi:hypothetical protein RRG08_019127 [Elysia crispata]|uniref:Uncharacterized protein n=1 Tax=Elysia crispata TaxID=231223 RepID=A0AAE1AJN3_9GAST|nr:hypothetical protein RRG08_019127 [Elysia crispata]